LLGEVEGARFDHIEEIQAEIRADHTYAEEFRRNHPSVLDAKLGLGTLEEAS
jgi:hypothetical protein